jgi:hypothetical protein
MFPEFVKRVDEVVVQSFVIHELHGSTDSCESGESCELHVIVCCCPVSLDFSVLIISLHRFIPSSVKFCLTIVVTLQNVFFSDIDH